MKKLKKKRRLLISIFGLIVLINNLNSQDEERFLTHRVNPKDKKIRFYWKNDLNKNFVNFKNLKDWLAKKNDTLIFAVNGGMYKKDLSPKGLYIENGEVLVDIDTASKGYGNFYMKPNGIFYLESDYTPGICETENFSFNSKILFATQSGPLLLINGVIHKKFINGSTNLNIRNGVGILPDGDLLFVISKTKTNFYDFASYFKMKGCKYALYLDGFVSRTYLPSKKWIQLDGRFGVMIGEIK